MEGEHTLRYWRLTPGYNELLLHYVQYGKEYLKIGGEIGIEFRQWLDATYAVLKNQVSILIQLTQVAFHRSFVGNVILEYKWIELE
jgi:hypothetical protein